MGMSQALNSAQKTAVRFHALVLAKVGMIICCEKYTTKCTLGYRLTIMDRKGDDDDDRFHIVIFYSLSIFCLAVIWLVPHETSGISMRSVYTIQTYTMSRHFTQSHVRRVHEFVGRERERWWEGRGKRKRGVCLLHIWQNDRGVTAVTRG